MRIPYVIDSQAHKMADVLNTLLKGHEGKCLDIATAYFNVRGFRLLQDGLVKLGNFRLLIGDEPEKAESIGLILKGPSIKRGRWGDLQAASFTEETLRTVEDLIAFLRREDVQVRVYEKGFLHAKCYLFYGDSPSKGWDRFHPVAAIVGSSNLTGPGLTSNKELNLNRGIYKTSPESICRLREKQGDKGDAFGHKRNRREIGTGKEGRERDYLTCDKKGRFAPYLL